MPNCDCVDRKVSLKQCCGSGSKGSASFCRTRIHNIFHGSRSEPSSLPSPLPSSFTLDLSPQLPHSSFLTPPPSTPQLFFLIPHPTTLTYPSSSLTFPSSSLTSSPLALTRTPHLSSLIPHPSSLILLLYSLTPSP